MGTKKRKQYFGKRQEQETLEISSTGYGLESVSASEDWGNNLSAQKQENTESSRTDW